MSRLATCAALLAIAAVVPSRSYGQMPSSAFSAWTSIGVGVASSGTLLWHGSAWLAPEKVAVGVRQSGRSVFSADPLLETSVLVGLRPQYERATLVITGGIALQNRFERNQPSCFGCQSDREFFTGEVAPTIVVEATSDADRIGFGFSATAVGGRHAFLGLSAVLRIAFLQRDR